MRSYLDQGALTHLVKSSFERFRLVAQSGRALPLFIEYSIFLCALKALELGSQLLKLFR
jgi:hypothetical protein